MHRTCGSAKAEYSADIKYYKYKSIDKTFLKTVNNEFTKRIIGQEQVKNQLLASLYPLAASEVYKPVVILFFGPSGVGKTETAKLLSDLIGEKLFRKQLSMFHNDEFASYIFGGKHSNSSLSRDLLERKSNIILFDEFDKPHPIFHSAFYQIFDEGIFEDKNYKVEMNNTIIICTSNYKDHNEIIKKLGGPIYSRFDAIIEFKNISNKDVVRIIDKEFEIQYSNLSPEEMSVIEKSNIVKNIKSKSSVLKNVRNIRRVIKEAISYTLVKNILNE